MSTKQSFHKKNGGRHDSKDDCFPKEAISSHVKLKKKNYSSVKFWINWIDGEHFPEKFKLMTVLVTNVLGFWFLQSSYTSIGQSKVRSVLVIHFW